MKIKDVLIEQTPPALQPAAQPAVQPAVQPAAQPGAVKNVQQAAVQTKGQQTQGLLNVQALKQLLPGVDGTKLTQAMTAVKSGAMTAAHYQILGMAFQQLVRADPTTTVKVMNLLKRVQQEPVSEAGVLDYAKAIGQNIGQRVTGQTPTQTIGQAATSSAAAANAKTIGLAAAKQWANKAALLRQQALAAATAAGTPPANPRKPVADDVYKAHLEDFVNRVMFRGDMDALDAASKPQVDNAIAKLVASQGSPAPQEFIALALASLTARTNRPGSTPKPVDPAAPVPTTASVETELAAQGVRIRDNETQMNKALYTAGIDPRIKATGDPRADMLLKRFGYDPR